MIQEDILWAKEFLKKVEKKISNVEPYINTNCPYSTADGKYDKKISAPFMWTSGFWGGMMWLMYLDTKEQRFLDRAVLCSERMKEALYKSEYYSCMDNHDLGFVFHLTNTAHYRITGDEDARIRALHAATMLAGRFNLNGRYIRAWRNGVISPETRGYAIIDCMMNLPLLYWACDEYDDPRYAAIAKAHAETVLEKFVKPDGSVYHIVNFDPQSGNVIGYPAGQGYKSGSSWSRGQSWAVYGFTLAYKYFKDERFLKAACNVSDYVINHFGSGTLPPVDYMQPNDAGIYDASAAVITASGMLELAKFTSKDEADKYSDFAIKLLKDVYDDCDFTAETDNIVCSCTEMYYGKEHHVPLIYADFYLLEALIKICGNTDYNIWN